jgi:hypothetical protein
MATPKKFDWGDGNGKIHSLSKADYDAQQKAKRDAKGRVTDPPPGTYDPNLDAQEHAETRAYGNTIDDVATQRLYGGIDLGIATDQAGTQKTRNLEDYNAQTGALNTSSGRSLSDLLLGRTRTGEDYNTNLAALDRQYQQLGSSQDQAARKAGAEATGGAFAQSARKRAANEAIDKAPIDTAYQRYVTDSQTNQNRLGEDTATGLADLMRGYKRGDQDVDSSLGQTSLNYQRSMDALGDTETRAGDEHSAFGQDIKTAKQMSYGGPAVTGAGTPVPTDPYKPKKKPKVKVFTNAGQVTTP